MKTPFTIRFVFVFLLVLVLSFDAESQEFEVLALDPQFDTQGSVTDDIKSLSYAVDQTADSVWFLIETHTERHEEFWGYYLPIDTDDDPANGNNIGEFTGDLFQNINFDKAIIAEYYGAPFIGTWNGSGFNSTNFDVVITFLDEFKTEIRAKLSDIDANFDGSFSVVALTRSNFVWNDVVPNEGFLTTSTTTAIRSIPAKDLFFVFPNPIHKETVRIGTRDQLAIGNSIVLEILDFSGKTVSLSKSLSFNSEELNVGELQNGMYLFRFYVGNELRCQQKLVVIR